MRALRISYDDHEGKMRSLTLISDDGADEELDHVYHASGEVHIPVGPNCKIEEIEGYDDQTTANRRLIALKKIREMGNNLDPTAQEMQKLAAWAIEAPGTFLPPAILKAMSRKKE